MKLPALAVNDCAEQYEWEPAPQPATGNISGEELAARMKAYVERILVDPNWHAEQERKQAEKDARRKAREERLAARRSRKAA